MGANRVALLGALFCSAALFQNCAPQTFTSSSVAAPQQLSTGGNGTDVAVLVPTPTPTDSVPCEKRRNLAAGCFQKITGAGTAERPYEIKTTDDFLCINEYPSAHWELVNDIAVTAADGLRARGFGHVPIECFAGKLNGNYRTVNYSVDCSKDKCNELSKGSLFERLRGSTIEKMRVNSTYTGMSLGRQLETSGLAEIVSSIDEPTKFSELSLRVRINDEWAMVAGLAKTIFGKIVRIERVDIQITSNALNDGQICGLTCDIESATVVDSRLGFKNEKNRAGTYIGAYYGWDLSILQGAGLNVTNSYIDVDAGDCSDELDLRLAFSPTAHGGLGRVINSFWTWQGDRNCLQEHPHPAFPPRASKDLPGAIKALEWAETVWANDAQGRPRLRWLDKLQ